MPKTPDYKANSPIHVVNKHGRRVMVRADEVCGKLATGVYTWPNLERMKASDVQVMANELGLKYENKESASKAIEQRAGLILLDQVTTPRGQGGWLEEPGKQLRHENYALAVTSIKRRLEELNIEYSF